MAVCACRVQSLGFECGTEAGLPVRPCEPPACPANCVGLFWAGIVAALAADQPFLASVGQEREGVLTGEVLMPPKSREAAYSSSSAIIAPVSATSSSLSPWVAGMSSACSRAAFTVVSAMLTVNRAVGQVGLQCSLPMA